MPQIAANYYLDVARNSVAAFDLVCIGDPDYHEVLAAFSAGSKKDTDHPSRHHHQHPASAFILIDNVPCLVLLADLLRHIEPYLDHVLHAKCVLPTKAAASYGLLCEISDFDYTTGAKAEDSFSLETFLRDISDECNGHALTALLPDVTLAVFRVLGSASQVAKAPSGSGEQEGAASVVELMPLSSLVIGSIEEDIEASSREPSNNGSQCKRGIKPRQPSSPGHVPQSDSSCASTPITLGHPNLPVQGTNPEATLTTVGAQCSICLEAIATVPCVTTICGHTFHIHCHSKIGPACPLCRYELSASKKPSVNAPSEPAVPGSIPSYAAIRSLFDRIPVTGSTGMGPSPDAAGSPSNDLVIDQVRRGSVSADNSSLPPTSGPALLNRSVDDSAGTDDEADTNAECCMCDDSMREVFASQRATNYKEVKAQHHESAVAEGVPTAASDASPVLRRTIWMCLVCGATHGGSDTCNHAHEHFVATGHRFAVDVQAPRVWDYRANQFVHRLVQQLQSVAESRKQSTGKGGSKEGGRAESFWVDYGFHDEEARAQLLSSVDFVAEFYSKLLEDQLRSQELYYEGELRSVRLSLAASDIQNAESVARAAIMKERSEAFISGLRSIVALSNETSQRNKSKARGVMHEGGTATAAAANAAVGNHDAGLQTNQVTLEAAKKNLEAVRRLRAAQVAKIPAHKKALIEKDALIATLQVKLEGLYGQL